MANYILGLTGTLVMPENQAKALALPIIWIVSCWLKEPPEEWYMGADVWKPHRHPLSDDGCEVRASLCTSRNSNATHGGKVRRSTRAPCRQPKTKVTTAIKPYARLDARHPSKRTSALPYPGVKSGDDLEGGVDRDCAEVRAWVDNLAPQTRTRASSWPSTWLAAEEKEDAELAVYRRERARDADNALNPTTNVLLGSGLIIGNGIDWSGYSSNNWAYRIHGVCLLGENAFAAGSP